MIKVKVLLVVGTFDMSKRLKDIISGDAMLNLVAEANNAYTARDKIIEYNPDVMLLCNDLPRMSGIDFLSRVMPQKRMNALVIGDSANEAAAYGAGAKDFIAYDKCGGNLEKENICQRLRKIAGKKPVFDFEPIRRQVRNQIKQNISVNDNNSNMIIAMGASTGGTEAMAQVIRGLRRNVPGIVMVQHMPEGFTKMYASRLDTEGQVSVKEAVSGDIVKPGHVLLAPGDKQMRIVKINGVYQVECRPGPKVSGHCPSVDVLFDSVARVAGKNAIGVLMTGMGSDGAKGLLSMKNAKAVTIGQDEASCVVYGMPKVAYELGAVDWQVPLDQIASKIHYLLDKK
jgi:two-component system chemotaxis response regulator CheB